MRSSKHLHLVIILLHLAKLIAASQSRSLTIEALCQNAPSWTLMPDERHCDRFYVCTGRKDYSYEEFRCTKDYHFSSSKQRCVRGVCPELTPTTSCSATENSNVQRRQGDCTSFEHCSSRGELALFRCSNGHYFDAERHVCLPVAITPGHQCSCILPEHSLLANREDCRSYYRCEQGKAVQQVCPPDYYFDASVNSCLLDVRGVCVGELLAPQLGEQLQACEEEGSRLVPHTQDCSRYFVCIGRRAIELSCPKGKYFDVVSRYCTHDESFQCLKQTTEHTHRPPMTTVAALVQSEQVHSSQQAQKMDNSKQAIEQELNSNRPINDVIGNKLASKFLFF